MISTKNTNFEDVKQMFNEMELAEEAGDNRKVTAIMVDMQDWFMGSASDILDLQIAYLKDPELFEEMWKRCLSGPVHTWESFLFRMFPEKGELLVANSDIEKLMKENKQLLTKAEGQETMIKSYEDDFTAMGAEINNLDKKIEGLNKNLSQMRGEKVELLSEINRLKIKLFDLIEENEKFKK